MAASAELELDLNFEDEMIVKGNESNLEDERFDFVIGELEDILMDANFISLQYEFYEKYASIFSAELENKLEYTEIFGQYTDNIEKYISLRLASRLEWFTMSDFMKMLSKRQAEELEGDVFELLDTLGDFDAFKDLMLSHKDAKAGKQIDLSDLLSVTRQ